MRKGWAFDNFAYPAKNKCRLAGLTFLCYLCAFVFLSRLLSLLGASTTDETWKDHEMNAHAMQSLKSLRVFRRTLAPVFTLLFVATPTSAQGPDTLKKLCADHYLPFPIKVSAKSEPVQLMLAQEAIRKLVTKYDKVLESGAFFDGSTVRVGAVINGFNDKDEEKTIVARLAQRIEKDLSLLFDPPPKLDTKMLIVTRNPSNKINLMFDVRSLKDDFIITGAKKSPTLNYQKIWAEITNGAASLGYQANPKATSYEIVKGNAKGRLKTLATPEAKADGFVYRYYCSVELNQPANLIGVCEIILLTYTECRKGAQSEWNTVLISDSVSAIAGFKNTTAITSVVPLHKLLMAKLAK